MSEANNLIDNHLKTIGLLITVATQCDLILYNAFKIISGCNGKTANAIYFAFESFQSKKTIINRVLIANQNKRESEIVNRIIKAVDKAQNQRNELSHAMLQVKDDQLLRLNARQQAQPSKTVTDRYLDSLYKEASLAMVAALKEYQRLCQMREISASITHE